MPPFRKIANLVLALFGIIVFYAFAFGQSFDRDFLNLKNLHPELFKAYSNVRLEEVWKFLDSKIIPILNPVSIGIIDTGVDAEHPEFKEKVNFGNTPVDLKIDTEWGGHGTQVAGIIGVNNSLVIVVLQNFISQTNIL